MKYIVTMPAYKYKDVVKSFTDKKSTLLNTDKEKLLKLIEE
jgi:hypothetical protein